jgi:hypothetical protein
MRDAPEHPSTGTLKAGMADNLSTMEYRRRHVSQPSSFTFA